MPNLSLGHSLVLIVASASLVVASLGAETRSPRESDVLFREHFSKIYHRFDLIETWNLQEVEGIERKLRQLTTEHILKRLNSKAQLSPEGLEHELDDDFANAIGGMSLEELQKYWRGVKYASVFATKRAKFDLYVIGYYFQRYTDRSVAIIQTFSKGPNGYRLIAETGKEMADHTLRLIQLKSFTPQEIRFLAFGKRPGSPHSFARVALYGFTGRRYQLLWQKDHLSRGQVSLRGDKVVIYWFDDTPGKPWVYNRGFYAQVPDGLKLERVEHGPVQ